VRKIKVVNENKNEKSMKEDNININSDSSINNEISLINSNNENNDNKSIKNNNNNVGKQDASTQADLLEEIVEEEKNRINKKYKIKENKMKQKIKKLKENLELMKEENNKNILNFKKDLNVKKEEIIKLTSVNFKMKKKLEKLSDKVNELLKKMEEKKKLNDINKSKNSYKFKMYNLNKNNDDSLNNNNDNSNDLSMILNIKNNQLKDSLAMIEYLTKEKNKLKSELQSKSIDFNGSAIYINKNKYNTRNKNGSIFNLKRYDINDKLNESTETKEDIRIENGQEIKNKMNEENGIVKNDDNDFLNRRFKYGENISKKVILKNLNKTNKRAFSTANLLDSKKRVQESVNSKVKKLFNDSERKALSTLFKSNEEFECFNQKMSVLQNHNSSVEKKLQMKIKNITKDNDDKIEQIEYLQNKLKESESKLKILEHKYNYEKYLLKLAKKPAFSQRNNISFENTPSKTFSNINFKNNKE